jgi:microcin C transport system permease protein
LKADGRLYFTPPSPDDPDHLGHYGHIFCRRSVCPGGPVERVIAQLSGQGGDALDRLSGGGGDFGQSGMDSGSVNSKYRGAQGLDPQFIADLEKQFGFDKPPLERFGLMLWNYMRFDFGHSYFRDISVIDLIKERCQCRFRSVCGSHSCPI